MWLSLDFDFFFREDPAWDWGHAESAIFQHGTIWASREAGYNVLHPDKTLREVMAAEPTPKGFVAKLQQEGLTFHGASLYVADSHKYGIDAFMHIPTEAPDHIIHIDAHHDLGYKDDLVTRHIKKKEADCADWLLMTLLKWKKLKAHIIYPPWRQLEEWTPCLPYMLNNPIYPLNRVKPSVWGNENLLQGNVDTILLVRSGSWVPPWFDHQFIDLMHEFEVAAKTTATNIDEDVDVEVPRDYSEEAVTQLTEFFKESRRGV